MIAESASSSSGSDTKVAKAGIASAKISRSSARFDGGGARVTRLAVPASFDHGETYGQETVSRSGSESCGALCQTSRGGPIGVRPLEVIQACTSS